MKRIGRIVFLFGVYVLASAVLLELLLRLVAPTMGGMIGMVARLVVWGQPYSETWTPAWQQNREHYYALRPHLQEELQYGSPSVRFRLTTTELWEGGGIGFRTRPIDYFVDAVVVGDSFGMCFTEQADCWVDLLEKNMNWGMVNLSQPVTGSTSHFRILRDFGAPLKPPVVIWQFFGNDFNDDYGLAVFSKAREAFPDTTPPTEPAPPSFADTLRAYSVTYALVETILNGRYLGTLEGDSAFDKPYTVRFGSENQHVLQFGSRYEVEAMDILRRENIDGLKRSRQAFKEAKALVESWGGKLIVVILPTREEVYSPLTAPYLGQDTLARLESARLAMGSICREFGLTCYDMTNSLKSYAERGEALYFTDDMHLNPRGNAVLAASLATLLQRD